jgi:hypothetical protein
MTLSKGLAIAAVVVFVLAAFNAAGYGWWIPVGLALLAASQIQT